MQDIKEEEVVMLGLPFAAAQKVRGFLAREKEQEQGKVVDVSNSADSSTPSSQIRLTWAQSDDNLLHIDPFSHPHLIPPYDVLSEQEKEEIRKGCIQLQDAYDGRASHGLYSLLKGPAYKRSCALCVQTLPAYNRKVIT